MATTIITKNGSGAPLAGDLTAGELAVDLTNKRLYSKDSGGTVIELGTNAGSSTLSDLTVTGDLTVDSGTLYVDSTNNRVNVGNAGTVTPYSQGDNFVIDAGGTDDGMSIIGSNSSNIFFGDAAGPRAGRILYLHSDDSMNFYTNGNNIRMAIDSDGNVGIGTTNPSSPNGFSRNLTISGSSCSLALDETDSNTWEMIASSGSLRFYDETNERMRINSSGNLVMNGTNITSSQNGFNPTTSAWATGAAFVATSSYGGALSLVDGSGGWSLFADTTGANLRFAQGSTSGGLSTKVSMNSSGNVGIGEGSPDSLLHLKKDSTDGVAQISYENDARQYNVGLNGLLGDAFNFYDVTAAANRYVIDTSGNFMFGGITNKLNGNTTYSFQNDATSDNSMWIHNNHSNDASAKLVLTSQRTSSTAYNFIDCGANYPTSFTRQFLVRGDGVVYAQNTSIQSLSDERTKENIRDSEDGLDVINALRPVRFDFKEGFGNNRTNQLGFIAQEVEPVFADAVSEATETDERGLPYKSLGPSSLIPVLVKAIQELSSQVDELKAQVAELQGAN